MAYIPSKEEVKKVHGIRDSLIEKVKNLMDKQGIKAKIMAVGSTAKDTFVSGDMDIDIFIVTPEYKRAYSIVKQKFLDGKRKEGPMDIWHFIHSGYDVDLVCIPPDHPRIQSLEHTAFMNRNLTPEEKREVIKAKALFKSRGVYGAEIGGIVGVALEELVRRHHNLENVCRVLTSKKEKPFLPDPVNPKRDMLASIVKRRWEQIRKVCEEYLHKKKVTFRPYSFREYVRDRVSWKHLLFSRRRDRATDFTTALSTCHHALNEIRNREPEVKGKCDAYVWNKTVVSYKVTPEKLPKTKLHCGPPIKNKEAVEAFRLVHPDSFVKNGRICTLIERERTDINGWMAELIYEKMKRRNYEVYVDETV